MVAAIREKNNYFYCSYCRIQQRELQPYCCFCGAEFTNYEEMAIRFLMLANSDI